MSEIKFGDVLDLKKMVVVRGNAVVRAEYDFKAPKDELFLVVFLGVTAKRVCTSMTPEERIRMLGFTDRAEEFTLAELEAAIEKVKALPPEQQGRTNVAPKPCADPECIACHKPELLEKKRGGRRKR